LIGLKELYGENVVDVEKRFHIYDSYPKEKLKNEYGLGMTITRCVPDLNVDRTDIVNKIKNKYFDIVIYGSVFRNRAFLQEVSTVYPRKKIICIDGEDETILHDIHKYNVIYFKREINNIDNKNIFPISFGLPTIKINFNEKKIKDYSFITPLDKKTYIYTEEKDYYNDYSEARLGVTCKKAGWDCMRHYEILGNGCLPNFIDIQNCPTRTMESFPKELCLNLNNDLKTEKASVVYEKYVSKFKNHFFENNTAQSIAKKLINTINEYN